MTVPAPLVFPGGRTLAGWWRQLAPWQPRTWWVGHLLLHRVEALAVLVRPTRPDRLNLLILQGLNLSPGSTLEQLDDRLHLGRQLLGQLLRVLQTEGLATADNAAAWSLTEPGRVAAEQGEWPRTFHERRSFWFVESEAGEKPPHFLPLNDPPTVPAIGAEDWKFDVNLLSAALAAPEEWKRRFGFPIDVGKLLTVHDNAVLPPSWQRVVVDRAERLPVAVVQTEADRLLGFAVRQDGWTLLSEATAFALEQGWQEVFPKLTAPLPLECWQQAWRTWCQPRGLVGLGVETCPVEPEGHRLCVTAPPRLMERLRATRSDALKGEAWVLVGGGRVRPAALLDVVEEGAKSVTQQA
jgi:hypothetical protein